MKRRAKTFFSKTACMMCRDTQSRWLINSKWKKESVPVWCDVFPVTCDNTGLCGRERRCLSDTRHHHNGAVHSVPDHNITKYFASSHRKIWKYYRLTPAVLVTRHTGSISRGHQIPSAPPARLSSPLFGDYSLMFRWAFNFLQVWHSLEANNNTRFPYQLKP